MISGSPALGGGRRASALLPSLIVLGLIAAACSSRAPAPDGDGVAVTTRPPRATSSQASGPATATPRAEETARPRSTDVPSEGTVSVVYAEDGPDRTLHLRRRALRPGAIPETLLSITPDESLGYTAAGTTVLLYRVTDRKPEIGHGHFDADPHLRLLDRDGEPVADLGRAQGPQLSPDGSILAWVAPTEVRSCLGDEPEGCQLPPSEIVFAPLADLDDRTAHGPFEAVEGIEWASDAAVVIGRHSEEPLLLRQDGENRPLRLSGRYMAAEPTTGRVATSADDIRRLRVQDLDGRVLWERSFAPYRFLAEWSPDGRSILVQLVRPTGRGLAETRIRLLDAADGTPRELDERDANDELLWVPDAERFAYRRETSDGGFELVLCRTSDLDCTPAPMRWSEGINLLALET